MKDIREFRCLGCHAMFTKEYIQSISESKCRKCHKFVYFIQGTTTMEDVDNFFKEGDK